MPQSADLALAQKVGFQPAFSRAIVSAGDGPSELSGVFASLVDAPVRADADPAVMLREIHQLRGLLAYEEERREAVSAELEELQQQLQQVHRACRRPARLAMRAASRPAVHAGSSARSEPAPVAHSRMPPRPLRCSSTRRCCASAVVAQSRPPTRPSRRGWR